MSPTNITVISALITSGAVVSILVVIINHLFQKNVELNNSKIDKELFLYVTNDLKNQILYLRGAVEDMRSRLEAANENLVKLNTGKDSGKLS